ncbi:MAG: hypothetical protein QOD29_4210 [Alphaproteobacteria bacterium]|jgi:hypothetical protein|nr:hypothetical protein [Alphaproteobacteria bacterium]
MLRFMMVAIVTGLLMLFFERSNMLTTNVVDQIADLHSVGSER